MIAIRRVSLSLSRQFPLERDRALPVKQGNEITGHVTDSQPMTQYHRLLKTFCIACLILFRNLHQAFANAVTTLSSVLEQNSKTR